MKHLKKILTGAFIGVGVGFTVNLLFSLSYGQYAPGVPSFLKQYDSLLTAVTFQTLVYMGLGISQSYTSDIMNNQKRSLLTNTILHFIIILLPLLSAAYVLHWSQNILGLLSIAGSVSIIYFGIWISYYFYIKSQIKQINQTISKKNE